jgi:hypothetical protein
MDSRNSACIRCLYRDMSDSEYAKFLQTYIDNIPEEQKAPAPLYEERLNFCRQCSCLVNGMCRLCGCFVELRAAKKISRCADTPEKW